MEDIYNSSPTVDISSSTIENGATYTKSDISLNFYPLKYFNGDDLSSDNIKTNNGTIENFRNITNSSFTSIGSFQKNGTFLYYDEEKEIWESTNPINIDNSSSTPEYPVSLSIGGNGQMLLSPGYLDTQGGSIASLLFYSYDGIYWSVRQSVSGFPYYGNSIKWNNGLWVCVGSERGTNTGSTTGQISYSEDGISWNFTNTILSSNVFDVAFNNEIWVACGAPGGGGQTYFWYSENGIDWKEANNVPNYSIANSYSSIIYFEKEKLWIAVGYTNDFEKLSNLLTSEDGINWNNNPTPKYPFIDEYPEAQLASNDVSLCLVIGTNQSYTSDDGLIWNGPFNIVGLDNGGPSILFQLLSYNFGRSKWITVGIPYSNFNSSVIYTSDNGQTWSLEQQFDYQLTTISTNQIQYFESDLQANNPGKVTAQILPYYDSSQNLIYSTEFEWFYNSPPTLDISSTDVSYGDIYTSIDISLNFIASEYLTDINSELIILKNGEIDPDIPSEGTTFSTTLTALNEGEVSITFPPNSFVDVSGIYNDVSSSFVWFYNIPPTVDISSTDISNNDETSNRKIDLVFTTNEEVDFATNLVNIVNGSIGEIVEGEDNTYTTTFTSHSFGESSIFWPIDSIRDLSGSTNDASSNIFQWTFSNDIPTMSIISEQVDNGGFYNLPSIDLSFNASEDITLFNVGDIIVVNGSISNFSGSGKIYDASFQALTPGLCSIQVPPGSYENEKGNLNDQSSYFSWTFDNIPPTMTISSIIPTGSTSNINPLQLFFNTSEDITLFTKDDIEVVNGSISNFSGSGDSYRASFNAKENGNFTIKVPASSYKDLAGNLNTTSSTFSYRFDDTAPTIVISSSSFHDNTTLNVDKIALHFEASEVINGFDISNIEVVNGSISNFSGSGKIYDASFQALTTGLCSIQVPFASFEDDAGNINQMSSNQFSWTFDNIPPTMMISSSDVVNMGLRDISTIDLSFLSSKNTTTFSSADISSINGTISDFNGSGDSYSASFQSSSFGTNTIKVLAGKYEDEFENQNEQSNVFTWVYWDSSKKQGDGVIELNGNKINEGMIIDTPIGELQWTGTEPVDFIVYSDDFKIINTNELVSNKVFDYNEKSKYSVLISAVSTNPGELIDCQYFTIEILPVNLSINLIGNIIGEDEPIETKVGEFSVAGYATNGYSGDIILQFDNSSLLGSGNNSFSFKKNSDPSSNSVTFNPLDNDTINLVSAEVFNYEEQNEYSIYVNASEADNKFINNSKYFIIDISNVIECATDFSISNQKIMAQQIGTYFIGTFEPDSEEANQSDYTYTITATDPSFYLTNNYFKIIKGSGGVSGLFGDEPIEFTDYGEYIDISFNLVCSATVPSNVDKSFRFEILQNTSCPNGIALEDNIFYVPDGGISSGTNLSKIFATKNNEVFIKPYEDISFNVTTVGEFSKYFLNNQLITFFNGYFDNNKYKEWELKNKNTIDVINENPFEIQLRYESQNCPSFDFGLSVYLSPLPPDFITLNPSIITFNEDVGTIVGILDLSGNNYYKRNLVFSWSLIDNISYPDNDFFLIENESDVSANLVVKENLRKLSTYEIKVNANAKGYYDISQVLQISYHNPVTGLNLSNNTIPEYSDSGTIVGTVTPVPNYSPLLSYNFEVTTPDSPFEINNNDLVSKEKFTIPPDSSFNINIECFGYLGGFTFDQSFNIVVTDISKVPVFITDPVSEVTQTTQYNYQIEVQNFVDSSTNPLPIFFEEPLPEWLEFTYENYDDDTKIATARLFGTPSLCVDVGNYYISLSSENDFGITYQNFNIYVNMEPIEREWNRDEGIECETVPEGKTPYEWTQELNMRRKAEILQYKNNGNALNNQNQFTQKQMYSMAARGMLSKKKAWGNQTQFYNNPNIDNLPVINNTLVCEQKVKNWSYASQSGVPGNPNFKLYYDKNVPLTRYPYIQRVFLAGSNKWPQRGWAPGDKGFPNKKAGNSSNP